MKTHPPEVRNPVAKMAIGSYAGFIVSMVIALLLSPILVRGLGDAKYGAWNLIAQVTGYYGLLDIGVRGAVGYFVARCMGTGRTKDLRQFTATAFTSLSALGVLILLIGIALARLFPVLFNTEGVPIEEVQQAVLVVSLTLALTVPMDIFTAAVYGARRVYLLAPARILVNIATAGGLAKAVGEGVGLVVMAWIRLVGQILYWFCSFAVARRTVPGLSVDPKQFRRSRLRELAGYGSQNAVIQLAELVIYRVDLAVIGAFLDMKSVAVYSIGQMFVVYASSAVSRLTRAFTTHFTHLHAIGDDAALRHSFLQGTRFSGLVGMLLSAYLLAFGGPFIRLWLKPEYASGPWTERSDVVLFVLLAGHSTRFLQSIAWQVLIGTGRQRTLMLTQILEAVLNLAISILLVRWLGLLGVALGTTLPLWLTNLVILPPHVRRELNFSVKEYWALGLRQPISIAGCVISASLFLVWALPPDCWNRFLLDAGIAAGLGGGLVWRFGLVPAERDRAMDLLLGGLRRHRRAMPMDDSEGTDRS